jgi:glycosyltransferase involved in cell wall biosynthesis
MEAIALLIEACNFVDFPLGGQLNFARQMVKSFGDRIALVGISTDDTPVGVWVDKEFNGVTCKFFSFAKRKPVSERPFIPARLSAYYNLRKYRAEILSVGIRNVFVQAPEIALCVHKWQWDHFCYRFAGVENPLAMSRYPGVSILARLFDVRLFLALRQADVVLATADEDAINKMILRSNGALPPEKVVQFPTRVDTSVFFPIDKTDARDGMQVSPQSIILVTSGRINRGKGWEFLMEAFSQFYTTHNNAYLFFIGDGEDRDRLQQKIIDSGLEERVIITGHKKPADVARLLNAADLFVFASYKEGWPTVLIEALACHKPIVTTDVSGARAIVCNGTNGFVIDKRESELFAVAMEQALALEHVEQFSTAELPKYSLEYLATDVGHFWSPLSDA